MAETLGDVARRLGEKLLGREQLTHSQVEDAVKQARAETKAVANTTRLHRIASEVQFIVRLKDAGRLEAELRRVIRELQEIVGETPEQNEFETP